MIQKESKLTRWYRQWAKEGYMTPSLVGFTSAGNLVGSSAKSFIGNQQNLVCESKRMMGLPFKDCSQFLPYWKFKVLSKNGV